MCRFAIFYLTYGNYSLASLSKMYRAFWHKNKISKFSISNLYSFVSVRKFSTLDHLKIWKRRKYVTVCLIHRIGCFFLFSACGGTECQFWQPSCPCWLMASWERMKCSWHHHQKIGLTGSSIQAETGRTDLQLIVSSATDCQALTWPHIAL